MGLRNTSTEYGTVAKSLHWLVAIGVFTLIYFGLEQAALERSPERAAIRALHASVALMVFVLMTVRIVWRVIFGVPQHPANMPAAQRLSAGIVHWGLYVAVFVQLTAGAMVVATGGKGLPFFGLFSIPLPVVENRENHLWWEDVHKFSWRPIAVLLAVHVLAALYNHFIVKNDTLRRMTVGLK
jgi:cytochrome b561